MAEVLEQVSEFFYNPYVFWATPFAVIIGRAALLRLRAVLWRGGS